MFAVIRTGSKQYKVKEGDVIDVELFDTGSETKATFEDVLLVADGAKVKVGQPTVAGASVSGEILGEVKAKKVVAYKYRRREGYHRKVGHRQRHIRVKVEKIKA